MSAPVQVRRVEARSDRDQGWLMRELAQRYFLWDAFIAGEKRVDVHPIVLGRDLHSAAVSCAREVSRIVGTIAGGALQDGDERRTYALSPDVLRLALASHRAGDDASLVRVDLLLDEHGAWQVCEINADCPGGHNETLALPRLAREAGFLDGHNPTTLLDALCSRLAAMARAAVRPASVEPSVAIVYATAYAEDLQVCALVQRMLQQRGVRAVLVPPTAPQLVGGVLRAGGVPVQVLYRFFPTEFMEGQHNLEGLARAVEGGHALTLSSFAQMFAQSKMAMARVWKHADILPTADREIVRQHLPATFDLGEVGEQELVRGRARWVIKRSLGRVGEEVFVGRLIPVSEWEKLVAHVLSLSRAGEAWVAQRFVRQSPIATPWGDRLLTLGVYLLDAQFVGYFARVTQDSHVSHDALCLPVFCEGVH